MLFCFLWPLQTQRQLLEKAETQYNKAAARLKELGASYQEGSADKLLKALTSDVAAQREQVGPMIRRQSFNRS